MGLLAGIAAAAAIFSHAAGQLVVKAPGYRVVLSDTNGRILEVDDARGRKLLGSSWGCLWWLNPDHHATSVGGCSFHPRSRWDARASTLTLTYGSLAVVTLHARATYFDLRLRIANGAPIRDHVRFPAGLAGDTRTVQAGYAPDVLPGVKLKPAFFSRVGNPVQIYPSRWAFADYLALDSNGGHVALYSVNRGPIAPVSFGFLHLGGTAPCSGRVYCLLHQFETWVEPHARWTSPVVRVRVGENAQQTILDYRRDNGIGAYPSLASKLGQRLDVLSRAPLVKADVARLQLPFTKWTPSLQRLPSPILLHPVAYQPGGHDTGDPDFLPPDPAWGTTADLAALVAGAHARGDLFMPYDNLSWWDPSSPSLQATTPTAVGALDDTGAPQTIDYGDHEGVIVSPFAPAVRARTVQELDAWRSVGADCVFLDQLGARPWLRDFNPAAPTPLAYDDGWLSLLAPYSGRCLMAEDGWDRLAQDVVGFHGGLLMMQRELAYVDHYFGAGNWEPYPLATWLLHDKVLMYQHDLYPLTMAIDGEVMTWNMAFGLVNSFEWQLGDEQDPWLELADRLQQDFGPHYAGVPLASFVQLAPGVTRSVFGDLTVEANLSPQTYDGIASDGFLARTADGSLTAQALPGGHWLIIERGAGATTVRQPVGGDLTVTIDASASRVVALGGDGSALGSIPFTSAGGRTTFLYAQASGGSRVAAYRLEP
jgi:hypothetical protein